MCQNEFTTKPAIPPVVCGSTCEAPVIAQLSFCLGYVNYTTCPVIRPGEIINPGEITRQTDLKAQIDSASVPNFGFSIDCLNAKHEYWCAFYFPRCDAPPGQNVALRPCKSTCENMFTQCLINNPPQNDTCGGFTNGTGPSIYCTGNAGLISPSYYIIAILAIVAVIYNNLW